MRVLIVSSEYPPAYCGGIGIFYQALAKQLAALGVRVHVLADAPPSAHATETVEDGVTVHRVAVPEPSSARIRLAGWRFDAGLLARARARSAAALPLAELIKADVVETHDWAAPLWTPPNQAFVVRLHGAAAVLAKVRGERAPRLQSFLEGRLAARARAIVAVSKWIRDQTAEVFELDRAAIEVIPNGVDTGLFRPRSISRDEEIVYAGALRSSKGVPELLQALEIVLRARPRSSATLAGGPEGWLELSPRIRGLVGRLQLLAPDRVRLLGRVPQKELAGLYQRAGVCVFPSRGEAFGLACVEAMSCGAAVVASPIGAGGELVEHGRTGMLADPRDPTALAASIQVVLAQPECARRLGEAARSHVEQLYSIRRTAEATAAFYEHLLRMKQTWRSTRVA